MVFIIIFIILKIKLFIVYMVLYVNILFLKKFDISDIWDLYM